MISQTAKAYLNLNGVLQSLTQLCALDKQAKELIQSRNIVMQFSVRNGPSARLIFRDGTCSFEKAEGPCQIKLSFSSPEHFNNMMDGKANPGIRKGFTMLGFLTKDFTQLTKRLEYYLKPAEGALEDTEFRRIHTILTFSIAFHGLAEVGMHDPVGREIMRGAKPGLLRASIQGTSASCMLRLSAGKIETVSQPDGSPELHFAFFGIEEAYRLLTGKEDFLTGVGLGEVHMEGYMPVMMTVEHILPMVSHYLA